MRIGLLQAGSTPSELVDRHGLDADNFKQLLGGVDVELDFVDYAVTEGVLPANPNDCHGYVVTGSAHGVYDQLPWMLELAQFLRDAADAERRLVGVCFGHQIMADTFGGTVEKSTKGWGIGLHHYQIHLPASWMTEGKDHFRGVVSHQDQVVEPPPGAKVLAGNAFCPNAMLLIHEHVMSLQCHPEMSPALAYDLLELRRDRIGEEQVREAQATLENDNDSEELGRWMVRFLKG